MQYVDNIVFALVLIGAGYWFAKQVGTIRRNINLGKDIDRTDRKSERWSTMLRVAFGQSKMQARPIPGILHFIVYAGFLLINIEVLEILIDGLLGTHRVFHEFLGSFYDVVIGFFEILAVLVIVACVIFLIRRNVTKVKRFHSPEMKGWAFRDANNILVIEIVLMTALLTMNAAEANFATEGAGPFAVSQYLAPLFDVFTQSTLHFVERFAWWFHILGILAFLNYLPVSKHFHIILAFPNTWFSNLDAKGRFPNMASVTKEVQMMMDPNADPFAAPAEGDANAEPERFGAKDVTDLNWVNLMNAYSCTECGRCTSECPANITGKKLSPRKIMMDTRDRLTEVGAIIDANNGTFQDDGKSLLGDYITREELWACTSCNACTQACPVNIDPLSIIVQMRNFLVMEESAAPQELNIMMSNVENNGAPWQYGQADRLNWKDEA
ncbi:MAG: 4Fe-4S dicluster domain-containing protein [Bacteroidetes bacterium]|nr:MAG: 4Fe-4S dicluster domain-containing protein [Bacteroidota bacterium]